MKRSLGTILPLLLLFPAFASAQTDPKTIDAIVEEGKNHSQVMKHLDYLTHKIGHRLTSSPQLDKAYEWTQKQFKAFGCKNVHLEEWGEYAVGFDRGKKQVGRMTSPDKLDFEFTSPSWTPGTQGLVRGKAVLEPTTKAEFELVKDQLKGAWIISSRNSRAPKTEVSDDLAMSGIAGTVLGSNNDLTITSGNQNITWDKLPTAVRIVVRKQDMTAIKERIEAGKEVQLEFQLEQKFIQGPRKNYNVVAEIPGSEKPDEVVIVSGHLDSWDGPGSEGAQDNGTGTCVTLEAARILGKVKAQPKRTIRFILWTGEEQGLFGSFAYVKKHADELSKISAVFVDDGGTGYEGGVACIAEMKPFLDEAFAPAIKAFPELPMSVRVANKLPRFGGSDHFPFLPSGVPAFFWDEGGKFDPNTTGYGHVHHTQYDRYETAIPEYLIQSGTNSAAVSYSLACAPTLLPREPKTTPAAN